MKKALLLVGVHAGVLVTTSLVTRLFGLLPYLDSHGIRYVSLIVVCLVWGITGALISLTVPRSAANGVTGDHELPHRTKIFADGGPERITKLIPCAGWAAT